MCVCVFILSDVLQYPVKIYKNIAYNRSQFKPNKTTNSRTLGFNHLCTSVSVTRELRICLLVCWCDVVLLEMKQTTQNLTTEGNSRGMGRGWGGTFECGVARVVITTLSCALIALIGRHTNISYQKRPTKSYKTNHSFSYWLENKHT